jgi:hypothetical protein
MAQQDRDRLVALKQVRKGRITRRQATEDPGQSEGHFRWHLEQLQARGHQAVVPALLRPHRCWGFSRAIADWPRWSSEISPVKSGPRHFGVKTPGRRFPWAATADATDNVKNTGQSVRPAVSE